MNCQIKTSDDVFCLIKYLENLKFIKKKKNQFHKKIFRKDTRNIIHHHLLLRLFPDLDTTDANESEPRPFWRY